MSTDYVDSWVTYFPNLNGVGNDPWNFKMEYKFHFIVANLSTYKVNGF